MKSAIACPPTEELKQLLDGSLSGERQQECMQHMDACACCQAKLEEIATGGTNLSKICEKLHQAEPMATSAYWPALNALNRDTPPDSAPQVAATSISARIRNVPLHFLQPASDSAYLGRLAHFDVMRVIGRGGMGVVLEAFDSRLRRNVALKVLDPELAEDDVARQRFCREARAAASITHENVVAVHQVEKSSDEGLPYMVMQLIAGESLEQRLLRDKKLPLREIVRIGLQTSHGLAAAHSQGLIHRDIKPGNILLEPPQDRVKITDFGLARVEDDAKLTRTGFVSGTPLYMAPEQALGEEADPRSDLFSLGAILYEMCAGQPPFSGNSALAILKQIAEAKQKPLRELNPQTPEWLSETIERLLAKKPADRIQTAAHLAELFEFQWALMKTTSEDVPTVCQEGQRRQTIRNRWIAAGIGGAFLAVGLLAGKFMSNRNEASLPPAGAVAPAAAPIVSSAAPVATLATDSGTVWSAAFDRTSASVVTALEDGTVRIWDLPKKSVRATLDAHRGYVWSVQFSPDGKALATTGDDGLIKIWDLAQPHPLKEFQHTNGVHSLAFADDNRTIFAGDRGGNLRVWSLDDEKPLREALQPGTIRAIALSPDNETLATGGSDKIIRLWNAKTLVQKLPLEGHTAPIYGLAFDRDGRRLASVSWDHTVRIWDAANGKQLKSWTAHEGDVWSVAFSPRDSKLATGGTDGSVKLWDADTGKLLATYLGHQNAVHTVAFNADGSLLASGGRDGAVRIWKME